MQIRPTRWALLGALSVAIPALAQSAATTEPLKLPLPHTPCNMNCRDTGNVTPVPAATDPALDHGRHRLIVLTDLGADNDDAQSIVHLLLYTNDIDVEGLVSTTSTFMMDRVNPWLLERAINAYEKVQPNLLLHDSRYPTAAHLRSLLRNGSEEYGLSGVGPKMDSEGSRQIITSLRSDDPRPLWVTIWGGANTLAQALWRIQNDEKPAVASKLIARLRVYSIGDQDNSGAWIRRTFPTLFWIAPTSFGGSMMGAPIPEMHAEMNQLEWIAKNIQQGHGPLGEAYPDIAYGNEGDTESWLNLIPNGLNEPSYPNYGGWGGRFEMQTPKPMTFGFGGKIRNQNLVVPEPETRAFWGSAEDEYPGPMKVAADWMQKLFAPAANEKKIRDAGVPHWRWREDIQNDLAARMEWTTKPYAQANHQPIPELGKNTPAEFTVHSGQEFHLNAAPSHDPDHDSLSFYWFQYKEAGDYAGTIDFMPFVPNLADWPIVAPKVDAPKTIHFICRVTDKGAPPLSRYLRVIVHVIP